VNVCEPMKTITLCGAKDFVTFIDGYSKFITIYLLMHKSQVFKKFQSIKNHGEKWIKVFHMDNGGEFINKNIKKNCEINGIIK